MLVPSAKRLTAWTFFNFSCSLPAARRQVSKLSKKIGRENPRSENSLAKVTLSFKENLRNLIEFSSFSSDNLPVSTTHMRDKSVGIRSSFSRIMRKIWVWEVGSSRVLRRAFCASWVKRSAVMRKTFFSPKAFLDTRTLNLLASSIPKTSASNKNRSGLFIG